nr:hypothetical protein B0A51_12793 [Rachicladosporium sp. CCFEE 5018]
MAFRLAQAATLLLCVEFAAAGPLRRYDNVTAAENSCTSTLPASTTPAASLQTSLPLVVNGPTTLGLSLLSEGGMTETGLSGAQANVATETAASGMEPTTVSFTYEPETSTASSIAQPTTPATTTAASAATTTETTSTTLLFTYSPSDAASATTTSTASSVASTPESALPVTSTTYNTFPTLSNTTTAYWGSAYSGISSVSSEESSSASAAESHAASTAAALSSQVEASTTPISTAVPSFPTFAYPLPSTQITSTAETAAAAASSAPGTPPAPPAATTTGAYDTDRPRWHHGRPTDYTDAVPEGSAEKTHSSGVPGITIVPLNPSVVYITTTVTETTGVETVTASA